MFVFHCVLCLLADTGSPANVSVVHKLLATFNNSSHPTNDTVIVFQDGQLLFLSRAILTSQCLKMTPFLYNSEGNL